jgi:hypothetical protein
MDRLVEQNQASAISARALAFRADDPAVAKAFHDFLQVTVARPFDQNRLVDAYDNVNITTTALVNRLSSP